MPLTDAQRQHLHSIDRALKQVDADLTRVGEFSPEAEPLHRALERLLDERASVAPELQRLRQLGEAIDEAETALETTGSVANQQALAALQAEREAILKSLGEDAALAEPAPPEVEPPKRRTWIDRF